MTAEPNDTEDLDRGIFAQPAPGDGRLSVRVLNVRYQGLNLMTYTLTPLDGGALPAFDAGAHLDVFFADGKIRQYSLNNNPADENRYEITVQRETGGRGGSAAIFENVRAGQVMTISAPRNNFPLNDTAARHLFIAGGVGITPIKSMISKAEDLGQPYALHYCTRSPDRTAFMDDMAAMCEAGRAHLHHDGGDPKTGLDIAGLLKDHADGTHLYCCGPTAFMDAVKDASNHWPEGTVHFEYFTAPEETAKAETGTPATQPESGFTVKLAKTGGSFEVPSDKSIVEVLRDNGIEVETSCESGLCATCRVTYLEGTPEHHDYVLSDEEKETDVLICCARSLTPELVLDL